MELDKSVIYIVWIQDNLGNRHVECKSENEVWDAIGSRSWGGLYQVSSPWGYPTDDFIPF